MLGLISWEDVSSMVWCLDTLKRPYSKIATRLDVAYMGEYGKETKNERLTTRVQFFLASK